MVGTRTPSPAGGQIREFMHCPVRHTRTCVGNVGLADSLRHRPMACSAVEYAGACFVLSMNPSKIRPGRGRGGQESNPRPQATHPVGGLATTGAIGRENGPVLTGRMENEIMAVLSGRTEAMLTDRRPGRDGVPRGIGAGRRRDQRGMLEKPCVPICIPLIYPIPRPLPGYLYGPVTGILTGPGEKSGAEHVMCIAKNRRLQKGNGSNERIIRGMGH